MEASVTINGNAGFEQPPILPTPPPVFAEMSRNLLQRSPILPVLNSQEFVPIRPQDQENLARALTQFCIQEGLAPGIIHRHAFLELANVLLNFG
jgi:hypothetical protein